MFEGLPTEAETRELRRFGLTMAAFIPALFGLLLPWLSGREYRLWPWLVAAVFAGAALFMPVGLRTTHRIWTMTGHGLGWVNSRILLACNLFRANHAGRPGAASGRPAPDAAAHRQGRPGLAQAEQPARHGRDGKTLLMLDRLKGLWAFLRVRKKFWVLPIVVVLLVLSVLLVLAQGSAVAPFIWTQF